MREINNTQETGGDSRVHDEHKISQGERKNRRRTATKASKPKRDPPTPTFEGKYDELKGHTYDLGYNQHETYNDTIRETAEFVGKEYYIGNDLKRTMENMV